jgi:hypothetical protein
MALRVSDAVREAAVEVLRLAVRIHTRKPPALAVDEILGDIVTRLTGVGFVPQEEEPTKRIFVRSERPTWTIVVAVLFFPWV